MHFTPDQIGAAVGGLIIMLGALAAVIAKGWQALADIRGEVKHDHGGSMKDSQSRTEEKVDRLLASQDRLEAAQRGMAKDIGRLADADQRIEDTAHDEHERLWQALDRRAGPACTGWDHGDHTTPHTNQEDS